MLKDLCLLNGTSGDEVRVRDYIINEIKEYSTSTLPYDKIMLGLLYIQTGSIRKGVNTLDELCSEEPDLLITPAIRQYLREVTKTL